MTSDPAKILANEDNNSSAAQLVESKDQVSVEISLDDSEDANADAVADTDTDMTSDSTVGTTPDSAPQFNPKPIAKNIKIKNLVLVHRCSEYTQQLRPQLQGGRRGGMG